MFAVSPLFWDICHLSKHSCMPGFFSLHPINALGWIILYFLGGSPCALPMCRNHRMQQHPTPPLKLEQAKISPDIANIAWATKSFSIGNHSHRQIIAYTKDYFHLVLSLKQNCWTKGPDLWRVSMCVAKWLLLKTVSVNSPTQQHNSDHVLFLFYSPALNSTVSFFFFNQCQFKSVSLLFKMHFFKQLTKINILLLLSVDILGIEPRTLYVVNVCSATELYPPCPR